MQNINRVEIKRPSLVDIYLGMAFIFAEYSKDGQTKHGCLITDPELKLISCGVNGLPRGANDEGLPNLRPESDEDKNDPLRNKYFWMLHSERNALANCIIRPPKGSIAFVTGQCCNDCIQALWQTGISTVYMADIHGSHLIDETQKKVFNLFIKHTGIEILYIKPNFDFFTALVDRFQNYGFINGN